MKNDVFQEIFDYQIDRVANVLNNKAQEYADDVDRLANFKSAAALQHTTPVKALGGMMAKHTVSVYDMIDSGKGYPIELWDEKITDHINYLILLRAAIADEEPFRTEVRLDGQKLLTLTEDVVVKSTKHDPYLDN